MPLTSGLETAVNVGASVASYPLVDLITQGALYKDRAVPTQLTSQYYYPGVDLPQKFYVGFSKKDIQHENSR